MGGGEADSLGRSNLSNRSRKTRIKRVRLFSDVRNVSINKKTLIRYNHRATRAIIVERTRALHNIWKTLGFGGRRCKSRKQKKKNIRENYSDLSRVTSSSAGSDDRFIIYYYYYISYIVSDDGCV